LLRGEKAIFEQSLADANAWLGEYYDVNSAQVRGARQTLTEIGDDLFDIEVPDIFESLRLLRQFKALSARPANVVETTEAEPLLGQ